LVRCSRLGPTVDEYKIIQNMRNGHAREFRNIINSGSWAITYQKSIVVVNKK